jgi:hypothetical protein
MKKYNIKDLEQSLVLLSNTDNTVILDFKAKIEAEIKKRGTTFIKATDEYLSKLKRDDVYIRPMKESDAYYYKGMYGLFEKGTDKLLRRHTDTGYLPHIN